MLAGCNSQNGEEGDEPAICSADVSCAVTVVDCSIGPSPACTGAPAAQDVDAARCVLEAVAAGETEKVAITIRNDSGQYVEDHELFVQPDAVSHMLSGHRDLAEIDEESAKLERPTPTPECLSSTDPVELAGCLRGVLSAPKIGEGACE